MNKITPSATQARPPRDIDVDDASHFGTRRVQRPLSRGCDLVTFAKLSAGCGGFTRKGESRLPGYPGDQVDPGPLH